jgi:DNA-binding beta-propeller fold protein YncE
MTVAPVRIRFLIVALFALTTIGLVAPGAASAFGTLTQKAGTAGCINNTGSQGCQMGTRIGGSALAVSPDGKSVYATGFDSTSAVAVLDRDPVTGELTQKALPAGCWSNGGAGGCNSAAAMVKPDGVAVSHDGKNVYVADFDQNSVLIFDRAVDGTLTQKAGVDGCLSASGHGGNCLAANGLSRESRLVVSPDDKNLYVASSGGGGPGALAIFDRNLANGKLTQKAGADGCVSSDAVSPCAAAVGLSHPEGIASSPDGKSIYLTARFSDAVVVFERAADGTLDQLPAPNGCWRNVVDASCSLGVGLDNGGAVKSPAVSPDGKNLYVPASGAGAVAVFDRNTTTGAIAQKAGLAGCISWDGTAGSCAFGFGVREAAEVVVSPDGQSVYVAGANAESGIAVFDRDESNGELTQRPGKEGCISSNGSGGTCETGRNLPAIAIAISPDAENVYAAGIAVFDRDAPPPEEKEAEKSGGAGPGCPSDADCDGLADPADVCPQSPGPGSLDGCPLRLDEVTPKSGGAGPITVRLRGRGFKASPGVKLVRAGHPDVAAASVTRSGAQALSASFDLGDVEPGAWEIVVTQSGPDASARLPFTVVKGTPPVVRARLIGRGTTLNGYPWSGLLQVTNEGTVDARNALVRIDGFQTLSDATVIGPGASATTLDSEDSQSLMISIDRIPQKTTRMVIVRFTAVGPGHSFYHLRPTVVASSVPGAKAVDPSLKLSSEVQGSTATGQSGVVRLAGASGGGEASYKVSLSKKNLGDPPSFKVTRSDGGVRVEMSATVPAPATAPPGRSGASASSVATASDGPDASRVNFVANTTKKAAEAIELFEDANGAYVMSLSRKGVLDCLLTRRHLDQADYDNLANLADGAFNAQLIKLGVEKTGANKAIKFAISFAPGFMSTTFESQLSRALRAKQAGDPSSPYFGLNGEEIVKQAFRNCLPNPPPPGVDTFSLEVLTPGDPNDKVGPAGFRGRRYVARGAQMPYLVMFENVPSASAPAHEVRITDQLDASKLDLSTLELGPVYFGDRVAAPPPGLQSWQGSVDLRPAKNLIVAIDANLNRATGVLSWYFRGLDPATGELQLLPELGFLPPNKTSPEGQGGVSFTVAQVPGLPHQAKISNGATIVFDREAAISTPVFTNKIDARAPTSSISSAKRIKSRKGPCGRVKLSWRGKDSGAGIALQDILLSRNGRPYSLWRGQTKRRSSVFGASRQGAYTFFSVATDGAGNTTPNTGSAWDKLVRGVVSSRGGLTLRLRPGAAKPLRIESLQVLVDGKAEAQSQGVPAQVALPGLQAGGHKVTLVAKAKGRKGGKGGGKIRAGRFVVLCSQR